MAVIYLRHPVHGIKVEANEAVAANDRANGWVDFDPTPAQPEVAAPPPWLVSDLPDDFPGRAALIAGGLNTWAIVAGKSIDELQKVDGVSATTAKRIVKAMES